MSHARLSEICTDHPADLSKILANLVHNSLLASDGNGRGMFYFLPWKKQHEEALFDVRTDTSVGEKSKQMPPELSSIPQELPLQYLDWNELPESLQLELTYLASSVSSSPRVPPELLQETILTLCKGRYLGWRVLARLLGRNADDLLKRTLNPMVVSRILAAAFSSTNDPRQAYIATGTTENKHS